MTSLNDSGNLRTALIALSRVHLDKSAQWVAELLECFKEDEDENIDASIAPESSKLLCAHAFFCSCNYMRVVATLKGECGEAETFLRFYSLYLDGERCKEDEASASGKRDVLEDPVSVPNKHLIALRSELYHLFESSSLDAFTTYLLGVVLKAFGESDCAIKVLTHAATAFPLNWSAWLDLAELIHDVDTLEALKLPDHYAAKFFRAHVLLQLQDHREALRLYSELEPAFCKSAYLRGQVAFAHYSMREFDVSEAEFKKLFSDFPHRLEHMDTYSNILYVAEKRDELSELAQQVVQIDQYKPQTCIVLGNYYSLCSKRERAVMYFKRALRLNPKCLAAWTLMGHEFVEMENCPAAVKCYRRAVDTNPLDYRAWYGLGQTYEILRLCLYAVFYYRKACALRMWCALGECFEKLDRRVDAMKCFERADAQNDREGIAAKKLAAFFRDRGDDDSAARFFQKYLSLNGWDEDCERTVETAEEAQALWFLSQWHKKKDNWETAESYASKLVSWSGPVLFGGHCVLMRSQERAESLALLREFKSRRKVMIGAMPPPGSATPAPPPTPPANEGISCFLSLEGDDDSEMMDDSSMMMD